MLPPGAIFELKIHQNAYAAGEPLEKPIELTDPLPGFQGADSRKGRKGEGKGGKEENGRDSVPPLLFTI